MNDDITPIPLRVIPSSEIFVDGNTLWRQTDDGWAVHFRLGGGWLHQEHDPAPPELTQRAPTVVELSSRLYSFRVGGLSATTTGNPHGYSALVLG